MRRQDQDRDDDGGDQHDRVDRGHAVDRAADSGRARAPAPRQLRTRRVDPFQLAEHRPRSCLQLLAVQPERGRDLRVGDPARASSRRSPARWDPGGVGGCRRRPVGPSAAGCRRARHGGSGHTARSRATPWRPGRRRGRRPMPPPVGGRRTPSRSAPPAGPPATSACGCTTGPSGRRAGSRRPRRRSARCANANAASAVGNESSISNPGSPSAARPARAGPRDGRRRRGSGSAAGRPARAEPGARLRRGSCQPSLRSPLNVGDTG